MSESGDFVVVANRLPVDRVGDGTGVDAWRRSPGGLVTALDPVMSNRGGVWVGWSGIVGTAPEPFDLDGVSLHPVELSADDVRDYYEGFSNGTLWPLYHDAVVSPSYHRHWWDRYVEVNRRFADVTAKAAAPNATIWIQDYQLQLLPALLREARPDLRIGFFLHIPFPPLELFMQLPWRRQLIEGLLGADLVGFQTPDGAENFLHLAEWICGLERTDSSIAVDGRVVRAGAFPISIDFDGLNKLGGSKKVRERARALRRRLGDPRTVLLGVDRLDYTKGIDKRLKAYRELLFDGALTVPETVLVQVATPSRERVEHYRALRHDVERQVGQINGEFGRVGTPAVHYLRQSYSRNELCALYNVAEVMLVTPLRDGMNLVAKEYVASRADSGGSLVLSEFAGAAAELDRAFMVNPHDVDGLKRQIMAGVNTDPTELRERMAAMREQVSAHDVTHWAATYLDELVH
ncbi:MAG TPA: trehalose-6-phosphate synthase [Mycobacteriales bacterium]|jgi:trehalose 6-phosphate synthase|nr:trehalose-6-phosphate synthase [Mycobacteriales bacterium]